MTSKRKQYVLDKKFQLRLSFQIAFYPLLSLIFISSVLYFFANKSNTYIIDIARTQDSMIEMFLSTPALQNSDNPIVNNAQHTFKSNIGKLVKIKKNSRVVLYFIIIVAMVQTIVIFTVILMISHHISGPIFVVTQCLKELNQGKVPKVRPLRKSDKFQEFYGEFIKLVKTLSEERLRK